MSLTSKTPPVQGGHRPVRARGLPRPLRRTRTGGRTRPTRCAELERAFTTRVAAESRGRDRLRAGAGRGRLRRSAGRVRPRPARGSATSTASCSSPTRCRPASAARGRFFAMEHFGVEPDLVTVAKSIAGGLAALRGARAGRAHERAGRTTRSAAPSSATRSPAPPALAVLDAIEEEGLVERAAAIGAEIRARMERWRERYPADRRRSRPRRDARDRARARPRHEGACARPGDGVVEAAAARGLLLLKAGVHGNCIRVLVPLVIGDAELDEALDVWEEALDAVLAAVGAGSGPAPTITTVADPSVPAVPRRTSAEARPPARRGRISSGPLNDGFGRRSVPQPAAALVALEGELDQAA